MRTERQPSCPPPTSACADRGFSLVEALVAAALALAVIAMLLGAAAQAQQGAIVQPEAADLEQRLRTGLATLAADIGRAGAGTSIGCAPGPLHRYVAPIRPYRVGLRSPQPPGTFDPSAISILSAPDGARVAVLAQPLGSAVAVVAISPTNGSYAAHPTLGFEEGMSVAIVSDGPVVNVFQVTAVGPGVLGLELMAPSLDGGHAAGACVVEVEARSYRLSPDAETGAFSLSRYDGFMSELPVVDHVVGLTFEYHGEPRPARLTRSVEEPAGPWTTYGPKPPPIGYDNPLDTWPAGESCLFAAGDPLQVPRLPALGDAAGGLVPLAGTVFSDGPWCADGGRPGAFDADLFRIRRVVLTLRVEAPSTFLRGPLGSLFARSGSATGGSWFVPDRTVTVDIAPRNMGMDR